MPQQQNHLAFEIAKQIQSQGPITVAEYMQKCLLHPKYGYYSTKRALGADGDFVTAPEITPLFGEFIGAWLFNRVLQLTSLPDAIQLIELGAGSGVMLSDMLRVAARIPEIYQRLSVAIVDPGQAHRRWQQETLQQFATATSTRLESPRINWYNDLVEVPQCFSLLVANEVFDTLPARQWRKIESGWVERRVNLCTGPNAWSEQNPNVQPEFNWVEVPATPPVTFDHACDFIEISQASADLAESIAQRCKYDGGMALIIDYGSARNHCGWSLQAVKQHTKLSPLCDPGRLDLTVHADFSDILRAAQNNGVNCWGPVSQRDFLINSGIKERSQQLSRKYPDQQLAIMRAVNRLISPDQMGYLFNLVGLEHTQ